MPNNKTNKLPDDGDIKGPTPPTNPVEFSRWVQRPRVNPKQPEVQPDDSALRPKGLKQPDVNRSIGTDKPKQHTATSYLKPNNGSKTPPVASEVKVVILMKFLDWFKENNLDTKLSKGNILLPPVLPLNSIPGRGYFPGWPTYWVPK
tara:strand:+ start:178 stop:618 length:441 start_codon:yes stop_codon:yes gene_type:complete